MIFVLCHKLHQANNTVKMKQLLHAGPLAQSAASLLNGHQRAAQGFSKLYSSSLHLCVLWIQTHTSTQRDVYFVFFSTAFDLW